MMEARAGRVPFQCDDTTVKMCVTDSVEIETKTEALQLVSYCYRQHCKGAEE